jgi:hypothetical protein
MNKQNPFSVYDFLGYLIPGLFFYIIGVELQQNSFYILDFVGFTNKLITTSTDIKWDQVIFIIVICYIIGHILSFISSITIEKYSVWTVGYPSQYLLNFKRNTGIYKFEKNKPTRYILRTLTVLFLWPIFLYDGIIGIFLKAGTCIQNH